jgi:aromatic ring-opening dioxygenase catalytic subunit (LigB family)
MPLSKKVRVKQPIKMKERDFSKRSVWNVSLTANQYGIFSYPASLLAHKQLLLAVDINKKIGMALVPLQDENILIIGSGSTYHNMSAGFNPSAKYCRAVEEFNEWLKAAVTGDKILEELKDWESAPYARSIHPREDHCIPLHMTAATAGGSPGKLIYDHGRKNGSFADLAASSYMFED